MVIRNQTRRLTISNNAKYAQSFFDRLFGLLNPRNPRYLIFHTRFGLHTLFLKMPIDVILLDDDDRVVKLKNNLSPNRLFLYSPRYSTVIEMPKSSIRRYRIHLNDKISIE